MPEPVCPWWVGYFLISPLRRWVHDPARILRDHVHPGMTVLEPGPGMGYFTLEMARRVGGSGRIIAVDIQPQMLERLKRRAAAAGLLGRLDVRLGAADSLGLGDLTNKVDFTLAFAVVHEMLSAELFFREVNAASRVGATLLLVEPKSHVKAGAFEQEVRAAASRGFVVVDRPAVRWSRAALLKTAG